MAAQRSAGSDGGDLLSSLLVWAERRGGAVGEVQGPHEMALCADFIVRVLCLTHALQHSNLLSAKGPVSPCRACWLPTILSL